jgi:hypothetical protein
MNMVSEYVKNNPPGGGAVSELKRKAMMELEKAHREGNPGGLSHTNYWMGYLAALDDMNRRKV